jgi:hypothetical protein
VLCALKQPLKKLVLFLGTVNLRYSILKIIFSKYGSLNVTVYEIVVFLRTAHLTDPHLKIYLQG